jgi:hypothetical protein
MPGMGFETPITLTGPLRAPAQMLADQEYGGHASVHDDAEAAKLGLAGAPIEGPTHFSQIDPLAVEVYGQAWFERGCVSAHFLNMVVEGEEVRASLTRTSPDRADVTAEKADGTPVLRGTATLGPDAPTALADRLHSARSGAGDLFIVDQLELGMKGSGATVTMRFDEHNGKLYPFTLAQKLEKITEPCPWYTSREESPWGEPIVPTEMISVLAHKRDGGFPTRGPAVGLFIDLEVRYVDGPVVVGRPYRLDHTIVGLGQSRRVESYWTESTITDDADGRRVATVLLHQGVFKASYAGYPTDRL